MVVDRSFLRPVLRRFYIDPLFRFVPSTLSPNSITASGLMACLLILGLAQVSAAPSAVLAAACLLLVNFYILADHFDGMQAKKYGRASRFGEFLDHFCDFFSGTCIILGAYAFTEMSFHWLIVVSVAYVLAFMATHYEHNASGCLRFPLLGDLEALVIAAGFFFAASLQPQYWIDNQVLGIRYQYLFAGFFIFGFTWCALNIARRMRASLRRGHVAFVAGVVGLGLCSVLLPQSWPQLWLVLILFAAANVASVLAGERLYAPRLACRELPVLAALLTITLYAGGFGREADQIGSFLLLAYAVARSAPDMLQSIRTLRPSSPA